MSPATCPFPPPESSVKHWESQVHTKLTSQPISRGGGLPGIPTFDTLDAHRQWIREHMAAAFRVMARHGLCEGIAGHISVRDPGDKSKFWMNPLGRHFAMMRASDMVLVDYEGNIVGGSGAPINAAGFQIHSAIHHIRPDIDAAVHAHGIHGRAWSCFGRPLDMLVQDSCAFYNSHSVYQDFGGIVFDSQEAENLAAALGNGKSLILQNHGLLTTGKTVDEAVYLFTLMERLCHVQLLAEAVQEAGKVDKLLIGDKEAEYTYKNSCDPESIYLEFQPDFQYEDFLSNGDFRN